MSGIEWVVEAFGCRAEALCSREVLEGLFARAVRELALAPVAPALWHVFPGPAGITGMLLLSESHLTCHTFPETGYAALNLYCCKSRPPLDFQARLGEALGARQVEVRTLHRGGGTP